MKHFLTANHANSGSDRRNSIDCGYSSVDGYSDCIDCGSSSPDCVGGFFSCWMGGSDFHVLVVFTVMVG